MTDLLARTLLTITILTVATACATWTPGWEIAPYTGDGAVAATDRESAERLLRDADSAQRLDIAIAALQARLAADPGDEAALVALADAHILHGAAYTEGRRAKRDRFHHGIQHAERALARNPDFRARTDAGDTVGDAAAVLTADAVPAMVFWATGVFYTFREGMNPMQRIIHFDRLQQARAVLERADELDHEYEHGVIPFSLAIYYIAVPGFAGRDFDRAEVLIAEALAVEGTSLLPHWGRAKYLHVARGDRAAFRADLEWVLEQHPGTVDSARHWNTFIRRDAARLLADIDAYF